MSGNAAPSGRNAPRRADELPGAVKLLGWTSFFTDAASEAIYPLLPVFVTRVLGGTALSLGLVEGAADAMSSTLKVLAGRASDRAGRRKPFVVVGYAIAGLVRPLMALATAWHHVFAVRLSDRVGKGLRSAPRDAMLGALAPAGARGRVFGYHRAMDHAGAVVGPLAAAAFLYAFPGEYRTLFALTIVPGALAVAMLVFVPDVSSCGISHTAIHTADAPAQTPRPTAARSLNTAVGDAGYPPRLKRFFVILGVFTLGNSTDAFLLLRLSDAGLAPALVPIAWAALHLVKSSLATHGGALSDRFGRPRMIVGGWLLYAATYAGFAVTTSLPLLIAWLLIYGVHFAMVEGGEKALVADLAPAAAQGAAFGWYNAVLGFGSLGASVLFGAIWETVSPAAAFLTGAGLALMAAALLAADRRLAWPS